MKHSMYAVRRLSVLGLAVVLASVGFAEDPVTKDDTAKDEPKTDEIVEPTARSTWDYLAEKYDADEDGEITPEEYGRDETHFKRLDVDSDGVISKAEIDERDRSSRAERGGRGGRGGRFGGGRGGRGAGGRRGPRGDGEEGASRGVAPLEGSEAPDFELLVLSEKADSKDADAEKAETTEKKGEGETVAEKKEKKLKLSSFEKDRPVALIFGSYT